MSIVFCLLPFKFINNSAYVNHTHRHTNRNSNNLVARRIHKLLDTQNFFTRAYSELNDSPTEIKNFVSLNLYKTHLREYLFFKHLWCDMERFT